MARSAIFDIQSKCNRKELFNKFQKEDLRIDYKAPKNLRIFPSELSFSGKANIKLNGEEARANIHLYESDDQLTYYFPHFLYKTLVNVSSIDEEKRKEIEEELKYEMVEDMGDAMEGLDVEPTFYKGSRFRLNDKNEYILNIKFRTMFGNWSLSNCEPGTAVVSEFIPDDIKIYIEKNFVKVYFNTFYKSISKSFIFWFTDKSSVDLSNFGLTRAPNNSLLSYSEDEYNLLNLAFVNDQYIPYYDLAYIPPDEILRKKQIDSNKEFDFTSALEYISEHNKEDCLRNEGLISYFKNKGLDLFALLDRSNDRAVLLYFIRKSLLNKEDPSVRVINALKSVSFESLNNNLELSDIKEEIKNIEGLDTRSYNPISKGCMLFKEMESIFGNLATNLLNGKLIMTESGKEFCLSALVKIRENMLEDDQNENYFYLIDYLSISIEDCLIRSKNSETENTEKYIREFHEKIHANVKIKERLSLRRRLFKEPKRSIHLTNLD